MTEPCGIIDTTVQCSENTFILLQQFSLAPSAEISRERCGNRPCISFKFSYFYEIHSSFLIGRLVGTFTLIVALITGRR